MAGRAYGSRYAVLGPPLRALCALGGNAHLLAVRAIALAANGRSHDGPCVPTSDVLRDTYK